MAVNSTQDGRIRFPCGLLGFPETQEYHLAAGPAEGLFWLLAGDGEGPSFLLSDPFVFFDGYTLDLTPAQAASRVQDYWVQHLRQTIGNKAARAALGLSTDAPPVATPTPQPAVPEAPRTITNNMSVPPPKGTEALPENMSRDQELRAALALVPENAWDLME